jgi:integrase
MTKRRANNEGSLYQRSNGTWRARVYLDGKRLSFSSKTRQEAKAWLRKTIIQVETGLTFQSAKTTLKDYLENWLVNVKTTLRPGTWYQYEMSCRVHILPSLWMIKLKDLNPGHFQALYNAKLKSGTGIRTIKVIHVVLHKALGQSVKLGMIGRNPTDAVTPPRYQPVEMKSYDESQVNQMLLAARGDRYEALYHLAVVSGMRQSELLALKWSDLDWQERTLKIQRQLKRRDLKAGYFTDPKTKAGKRCINLGAETIRKLRIHYEIQRLERGKAGDRWEENDLIFPSTIGTPLDQYNLLKRFRNLISKAGLPKIRFHDLRHTAASLMLNHGVPIIAVSRRLGHSKVSITLDTYAHLFPGVQSGAADLMDELVTPVDIDLLKIGPELAQVQKDELLVS